MDENDLREKISKRSISASDTILSALKKMDVIDKKLLLVFSNNHFEGIFA